MKSTEPETPRCVVCDGEIPPPGPPPAIVQVTIAAPVRSTPFFTAAALLSVAPPDGLEGTPPYSDDLLEYYAAAGPASASGEVFRQFLPGAADDGIPMPW